MKRTDLLEQFQNKILSATDNIGDETFDRAVSELDEAMDIVRDMKETRATLDEMKSNFGVAYSIVSANMDTLIKEERDFVGKWLDLLKSDKNLRGEVMFYESLMRYKPELNAEQYLTESLNMSMPYIDQATIKESLAKVSKLIGGCEIVFENTTRDTQVVTLFEDCQTLLETRQGHNTLTKLFEARKRASEKLNEASNTNLLLVNNIRDTKLNEAEAGLVKLFSGTEEDRKSLFENLRAECLKVVTEHIASIDNDDERNEYTVIKESISGRAYDEKTCTDNILKFLDVLTVVKG